MAGMGGWHIGTVGLAARKAGPGRDGARLPALGALDQGGDVSEPLSAAG
jgi:hypothetical protein